MDSDNKMAVSGKSSAKFILWSAVGIILFFVKLPIKGSSQLPIDFVVSCIQNIAAPYYTEILMVCSVIYVIDMVKKKLWKGSAIAKAVIAMSILGAVMIFMMHFKLGPAFMFEEDILPAAVSNMGKAFVMVYITSFFLPLLLNFGFVDFFGIIARPVMRRLFRLPGRTAVIAIAAFLGNFSVGHIQTNELYTTGRLTTREAGIINTSLCTTSIALLLLFANGTGMIGDWGKVFLVTALAVYLVTIITVRIFPLNKIPDNYYMNTEPDPEEVVTSDILSEAFRVGTLAAEKAGNPFLAILNSGKKAFVMVACIHVSAVFTWVIPALVNKYTPIFVMLGMAFKPLLTLLGMPNVNEIANAIGLSFVNPISATLGLGAQNIAPAAKFFAATFAAPIVIHFGPFLTSMYSTKVPVKFGHVVLLWFERAILVTLICAIFARVFFM